MRQITGFLIATFLLIFSGIAFSQEKALTDVGCQIKSRITDLETTRVQLEAIYIQKLLKSYRDCLQNEVAANNPISLYKLGKVSELIDSPSQADPMQQFRLNGANYCKSAQFNYLPGMEQCAWHEEEDKNRFLKIKVAALSGSLNALGQIANSTQLEQDAGNQSQADWLLYLSRYLLEHPSMIDTACLELLSDTRQEAYCKENVIRKKQRLFERWSYSQTDNNRWVKYKYDEKILNQFKTNAKVQLLATLNAIKNQIERFPHLAPYSFEIPTND
jgi:hypothetical protein